jgi:hypothetical protein
MKQNMQPLFFVVALVLQQHRPSNSKAIAYRQFFSPTHNTPEVWPIPKLLGAVKLTGL